MRRCGIDPGIEGALAWLREDFRLCDVVDMPVMMMSKTRRQVNAAELAKTLRSWKSESEGGLIAYLEYVASRPGAGVSGMFSFGVSYGIVQGILGALQIPMVLVTPAQWKKRAGLVGQPKDMARTLAQRFYPEWDLSRKKDIGQADAILIARFGDRL
jgi:crossover junction endodeoxyribonuclease RuvC